MGQFSRISAQKVADRLRGDVNFTLAVADVESGGRSDLPSGKPQILFEAQWFHKFTNGQYDGTYPNISSPTWNKALYYGGEQEYTRLNIALGLDEEAAYKSASWGLFQIMGFNFQSCGFGNVKDFVASIKGPDDNDMEAFIGFVSADAHLLDAYRTCDSRRFAEIYNGPGQIDYYAGKIDDARAVFAQGKVESKDLNDPKAVQAALGIPATGLWDNVTHYALIDFQRTHGLVADGIIGPKTRSALGL